MLTFYNTLSRKKETFKPIHKDWVGVYTCGPTVYDYAHIGNFRAYVSADVLVRYLRYKNYKVNWVMNLTDVDDKTIAGANKNKVSLAKFTRTYTKAFFADLEKMRIPNADVYPEATKHINEMIDLTQILLGKGLAYEKDGSIYFSIAKFKNYGELAQIDLSGIEIGKRIAEDKYEKEDAQDFVLWKGKKEGEPTWPAPFGEGRPGWHIECSAMSKKYLGQPFDIHTGGIDLVFPHHQNEIAQSEGAFDKKFVNFWMHNEHLLVDNIKMSKSLGNFYTLRDIEKKGHLPIELRLLAISSHYRDKLNFTWKSLEGAKNTLKNLEDFLFRLVNSDAEKSAVLNKGIVQLNQKTLGDFENFLDDDLNTPRALAVLFDYIRELNIYSQKQQLTEKEVKSILETLEKMDTVFAILPKVSKIKLSKTQQSLISQREEARKSKDFATADKIRGELEKSDILLEDTQFGPRWRAN